MFINWALFSFEHVLCSTMEQYLNVGQGFSGVHLGLALGGGLSLEKGEVRKTVG